MHVQGCWMTAELPKFPKKKPKLGQGHADSAEEGEDCIYLSFFVLPKALYFQTKLFWPKRTVLPWI